jgi:hypothetical protein
MGDLVACWGVQVRVSYPAATLVLGALEVGGAAQDDFVDHEVVRIHAWADTAGLRRDERIDEFVFEFYGY